MIAAPDGAGVRALRGHVGIVNSVAFSVAGTRVATGGDDGTARIWAVDGTPGPILPHPHRVLGVRADVGHQPDEDVADADDRRRTRADLGGEVLAVAHRG